MTKQNQKHVDENKTLRLVKYVKNDETRIITASYEDLKDGVQGQGLYEAMEKKLGEEPTMPPIPSSTPEGARFIALYGVDHLVELWDDPEAAKKEIDRRVADTSDGWTTKLDQPTA